MNPSDWHVSPTDLRGYLAGPLDGPVVASVEAHLMGCERCRGELAVAAEALNPGATASAWDDLERRLDASLAVPLSSSSARFGVPAEAARLFAAAPAALLSWTVAVLGGLAAAGLVAMHGGVAGGSGARALFLIVAPLLPLLSVVAALEWKEPGGEAALAAPTSRLRAAAVRAAVALVGSLVIGLSASALLPGPWSDAVLWLAPGLALSAAAVLLSSRASTRTTLSCLSTAWVAVAMGAALATGDRLAAFAPAAQVAYLAVAAAVGVALITRPPEPALRRLP